jgi:hypothetical protein
MRPNRLSLEPERWYAWDMLSPQALGGSFPSTPIFITKVTPLKSGKDILRLSFVVALHPISPRTFTFDLRIVHHRLDHLVATLLDDDGHEHTAAVSIPTFDWVRFRVHHVSSQFSASGLQRHGGEHADSMISIETHLNLIFGRTEAEVLSSANSVERSRSAAQENPAEEPRVGEREFGLAPTNRPVTREQATLFRMLVSEFIEEANTANGRGLRYLPSYKRLVHGAYATGFVFAANHALAGEVCKRVREVPDALLNAPFSEVRLFVHYLMRDERWSDDGLPDGGGPIRDALAEGHLRRLVERLPD